jgi:tape measure domain-containing protein
VAYRADIEIGVKGAQKLEQIKKKIQSIDQKVDQVNARWKKIRSGIPTKEFGEVNKKLQKTTALQARAKALAAATEKRLKGQNSVTNGLLRLNKAVLNAARSEAQARGESVAKQRELNRELAKTQQYSKPIGPKPAGGGKGTGRTKIGGAVGAGLSTVNLPGQDIAQAAFLGSLAGPKGAAIAATVAVVAKGVEGLVRLGPEVAKTEAEISKLGIALRGILGSQSAEGFKAIDQAARDFNQPIVDATRNFTQLSAAATANGNSVKQTETLYRALSAATKATGGDAEDLSGVLRAATQVISKGVVRSEELRGQIGDRLPGAFQLFAQATNRSAEELQKALEQGEVSAEEFVTTFSNFILKKYEPAALKIGESPAEAGARLTKALEDANRAAGPLLLALGAKFQDFAKDAIESITPLLNELNRFFKLDRAGKNQTLADIRKNKIPELTERTADLKKGDPRDLIRDPNANIFSGLLFGDSVTTRGIALQEAQKELKSLQGREAQLTQELFPTGAATTLKPGPETEDANLKGAPKAPKLPVSQAPRLQQQITQELLKQFDIKTNYMKLNMSELDGLDFQNTRLRERLQQEEQLLELQRQEALANSKYAADAELINSLFNLRKVSIQGETEAQIQQNLVSAKQLKIQEEITALRQAEETKNIERALTRNIEDVERMIASPFGGDEAEQIDLLVDQQRRYIDTTDQLKTAIAEQKKLELIDTSGAATKQREALEAQLSIYEKLLPQLNALEQAELRQNQLMEKYGFIADEAATAMSSAVQSVITGTGSVEEAFSDMFANIGKAFLDMATQMIAKALIMKTLGILRSAFGAAAPAGPGPGGGDIFADIASRGGLRANGGPVSSNTPYIVGEEGPELFIPGASGSISNNDQFEAARDALATGNGFTAEEEETIEKLGTTQQPSRLNEVLRDSRSAIESISRISKERETAGVNKLVKELGATSGGNGQTVSTFGSSTTNNLKERLGGDSTVEKIIAAAQQTAQAEAVSAARDALTQSGDEQNTDSSELKTSRDYIEKVANNLGSAGTNTVNNVSSSSTFGESRSTVDRITAINQTRQMLESVSSVNKERSVERAMENTASGGIKPIDVRYESQVINNVEYVTA